MMGTYQFSPIVVPERLTERVFEAGDLPGALVVDEDGLGGEVAVQHSPAPVQKTQALANLRRRF